MGYLLSSIFSKFVFLSVGRNAVCAILFYVPENYSSPCPICRRWPEHTPLHYAASHVNRHFWKFLKVRNHFIIKLSENYLAPYAADGPSTLHRFSWLNNSSCCLIPALSKKTPICHLMSWFLKSRFRPQLFVSNSCSKGPLPFVKITSGIDVGYHFARHVWFWQNIHQKSIGFYASDNHEHYIKHCFIFISR